MNFSDLEKTLKQRRVFVFLGAGGVGKTSCSIAFALAAARQGKRVALLSIDPAKRLAAALGIPLSHQLERLPLSGQEIQGEVWAAMLDQKAVFDSMVLRHASTRESAAAILANSVYRAVSTRLVGAIEYMALAKLQELVEDPTYEVIVLDTPPDTQALDFLVRPNVLEGFSTQRVMQWLIKPFYFASHLGKGRWMNLGERLMGGLARVTGMHALRLLAEFMILMQQVIEGFHQSGRQIDKTLKSKATAFVLVTTHTHSSLRSSLNLAQQLNGHGYPLDGIFLNRCLPIPLPPLTGAPEEKHLNALYRRRDWEARQRLALGEGFQRLGLRLPEVLELGEEPPLQDTAGMIGFSQAFSPVPAQPATKETKF